LLVGLGSLIYLNATHPKRLAEIGGIVVDKVLSEPADQSSN
jgi:hypothetical protein